MFSIKPSKAWVTRFYQPTTERSIDPEEQHSLVSKDERDERDMSLQSDLEKAEPPAPPPQNHEDTVAIRDKLIALAGYFLCNIGLTIYNKAILGSFRFPWLLTALHAGCSSIGCLIMMQLGYFQTTKLTSRQDLALIAFSFLFTINIAISNVSLAMVSVPFHQVVRATTPLVTSLLFRVMYNRTFSRATQFSLVPIVLGVTITVWGNFVFTDLGFILTFLGVVLAAFKTIVTNRMMTGSMALSFWEILQRMSPLAFSQSLVYAFFTGELSSFRKFLSEELLNPESPSRTFTPTMFALVMLGNGMLAFALNVSSFSTNKVAGALTMTVCGNIKSALTIILGIVLFNVHMTMFQLSGVFITVVGGVIYSFVELDGKRKKVAPQQNTSS
ncbi:hypothetical protein PV10_08506 [Exophiala mesophila]|uniref:Sugar phosphate transporter domain-containing protein n=1 Tax=Exophiala mesophila TaxID=212818 RepID=A0A0D1ZPZ5_EXOME|nr:uncharacterized protein PV10_08506 [Exophiala mesophila]KIV88873.1 hypothetical protein PV10_08506 [Exophiala mesophila]